MKPNVDLTLNRDFADRNNGAVGVFSGIMGDINRLLHGQHPRIPWLQSDWREIDNDDAFRVGESSDLIFMGNKEERAKKKFYNSEYDNTICYCCGAKITVPWKNRFRICPRCENLDGSDRVLWRR